jgi:hypothetical protein
MVWCFLGAWCTRVPQHTHNDYYSAPREEIYSTTSVYWYPICFRLFCKVSEILMKWLGCNNFLFQLVFIIK